MLTLTVPEQTVEPANLEFESDRDSIEHWLGELPLTNVQLSAGDILSRLQRLNVTRLAPPHRFALLGLIQPVAENLIETLRDKYDKAPLPLAPRHYGYFTQATQLSAAVAAGFRVVLKDLWGGGDADEKAEDIALPAFYMTLHHLSLILLDTYSVYFPEPSQLWGELNALYLYAERHAVLDAPILLEDNSAAAHTISLAYRRAVLLALANPYHLMRHDVHTVFRLLFKVSNTAGMSRPVAEDSGSCFFVDLKADAGPRFAADAAKVEAVEPRVFDVSRLLAIVQKRIAALTSTSTDDKIRNMPYLMRRMQRDMLRRLRDSWGRQRERQHERHAVLGDRTIAIGLSAVNHFVGGEQAFCPELEEIQIYTGYRPSASQELTLMPLELEPWKMEDAQQRLQAGIQEPRHSVFNDDKVLDVWRKVYATQVRRDADDDGDVPAYSTSHWELRNVSAQGLSMACEAAQPMPVGVGELIAYQPTAETLDHAQWVIGSIRWLRVTDNRSLAIGIMGLSGTARSVATRAIKGAGKGGEYFRALIVPNVDLDDESATLIVPAAIYDAGTELAVNLKDEIRYVRLTRILDATKSYAHFEFDVVETPDSETRNIHAMRAML